MPSIYSVHVQVCVNTHTHTHTNIKLLMTTNLVPKSQRQFVSRFSFDNNDSSLAMYYKQHSKQCCNMNKDHVHKLISTFILFFVNYEYTKKCTNDISQINALSITVCLCTMTSQKTTDVILVS